MISKPTTPAAPVHRLVRRLLRDGGNPIGESFVRAFHVRAVLEVVIYRWIIGGSIGVKVKELVALVHQEYDCIIGKGKRIAGFVEKLDRPIV